MGIWEADLQYERGKLGRPTVPQLDSAILGLPLLFIQLARRFTRLMESIGTHHANSVSRLQEPRWSAHRPLIAFWQAREICPRSASKSTSIVHNQQRCMLFVECTTLRPQLLPTLRWSAKSTKKITVDRCWSARCHSSGIGPCINKSSANHYHFEFWSLTAGACANRALCKVM